MSEVLTSVATDDNSPDYWGRHRDADTRYLTLQDRCEVRDCNAQAYVRLFSVTHDFELLFCGHHGEEKLPAAAIHGYSVQDERYLLAPPLQPLAGETQTNEAGRVTKLD